ncbi:DedA family protein [Candidatus Woesearchaeota archaeon]|nr:DedA family protein [Candidatus Woesearchaeota archaeon]
MVTFTSFFLTFIDILLHLDTHLQWVIQTYDVWTYALLFLVIFCETGLIIAPFLPGDSLLFAAGTFAALGSLDLALLFFVLFTAAVLGDFVNYSTGRYMGPRIFKKEDSFFFHKDYLLHTEQFYESHGPKTIILARFMPVIRTFAPFVAGIGKMKRTLFVFYNVLGALLWCVVFILGGYYFGLLPFVQEHFTLVLLLIIFLSFLPLFKALFSAWRSKRKEKIKNKNT